MPEEVEVHFKLTRLLQGAIEQAVSTVVGLSASAFGGACEHISVQGVH